MAATKSPTHPKMSRAYIKKARLTSCDTASKREAVSIHLILRRYQESVNGQPLLHQHLFQNLGLAYFSGVEARDCLIAS